MAFVRRMTTGTFKRPTTSLAKPQAQPKARLPGQKRKVPKSKAGLRAELRKIANAEAAEAAADLAELKDALDDDDGLLQNPAFDDDDVIAWLRRMKGSGGLGDIDELKLLFMSEAEAESGASTARGIKRKGNSGGGNQGGDGWDGEEQRQAQYEKMMLGNISEDEDRFQRLRAEGAADAFEPSLDGRGVEGLGLKAASHMVRLYDHLRLDGLDRDQTISKAASLVGQFMSSTNRRRLFTELENSPIRDIYPLEVMLRVLEDNPRSLPGVRLEALVDSPSAQDGIVQAFAGHPFKLTLPPSVRLKGFALLGGDRPGYEFFPDHKDGQYVMQVDTPGVYEFAVMGVGTRKLGRMDREVADDTRVHRFAVQVEEMGAKPPAMADAAD